MKIKIHGQRQKEILKAMLDGHYIKVRYDYDNSDHKAILRNVCPDAEIEEIPMQVFAWLLSQIIFDATLRYRTEKPDVMSYDYTIKPQFIEEIKDLVEGTKAAAKIRADIKFYSPGGKGFAEGIKRGEKPGH